MNSQKTTKYAAIPHNIHRRPSSTLLQPNHATPAKTTFNIPIPTFSQSGHIEYIMEETNRFLRHNAHKCIRVTRLAYGVSIEIGYRRASP
jgi:hypothetical protein